MATPMAATRRPLADDSTVLRVSASALASTAICSTKVALSHLGYDGKEPSGPQMAGQVAHEALAAWLKGLSPDEAVSLFKEKYDPWAATHVEPDDRLEASNLAKILGVYMRRKTGQLSWKPQAIEEPFEVDLNDDGSIKLIGVFDVRGPWQDPGSDSGHGQSVVVENKTTGRISSLWVEGYQEDPQLTAYWYAHQEKFGRVPLYVVVNAIEFSRLPLSDRPCRDHGRPMRVCHQLGTHAKFSQFLTTRDPDQVEAWRQGAILLANRYRRIITRYADLEAASTAPQEGKFVRGSSEIGCKGCQFKNYCFARRPVPRWEQFLSIRSGDAKVRSGLYPA